MCAKNNEKRRDPHLICRRSGEKLLPRTLQTTPPRYPLGHGEDGAMKCTWQVMFYRLYMLHVKSKFILFSISRLPHYHFRISCICSICPRLLSQRTTDWEMRDDGFFMSHFEDSFN